MVNYSGSGIQHEKLPPTSGDKVDNPVFGEAEDNSNYTATVKSKYNIIGFR